MKIYKDEIHITRGETWNFDVKLVTPTGAPLIISSKLQNPHFLLTVSSLKYPTEDRVIRNYFCDLVTKVTSRTDGVRYLPTLRFVRTKPISVPATFIKTYRITEFKEALAELDDPISSLESVTYKDDLYFDEAVFVADEDGVKKYYYFTLPTSARPTAITILPKPYEQRFVTTFLAADTCNWIEQEYSFAMKLIDFNKHQTSKHRSVTIGGIKSVIDDYDPTNIFDRIDASEFTKEDGTKSVRGSYSFVQKINVPPMIKVHSNITGSLIEEV